MRNMIRVVMMTGSIFCLLTGCKGSQQAAAESAPEISAIEETSGEAGSTSAVQAADMIKEALQCKEKTASGIVNILESSDILSIKSAAVVSRDDKTIILEIETQDGKLYYVYMNTAFTIYKILSDRVDGPLYRRYIE